MEGNILGIESDRSKAAVKASNGSRYYFAMDQWKGSFQLEVGMKVDFDINHDGVGTNVYPLEKTWSQATSSKPNKSKTTATLLAFFLGGLGGHKFYLGAWGWGLIYLIFCWTYIPLVLGIIEVIRYIVLEDEEFQEKYAKLGSSPFAFLW